MQNREFQVGQPKKKSAVHRIGETLCLVWFGLMLLSPVIRWMITNPCDRARSDLTAARAEEKKEWTRVEQGKYAAPNAGIAVQDAKDKTGDAESSAVSACR